MYICNRKKRKLNAKVAQLVEHDLAKVRVASSNLVFRSKELKLLVLYTLGFFLFWVQQLNRIHYFIQSGMISLNPDKKNTSKIDHKWTEEKP